MGTTGTCLRMHNQQNLAVMIIITLIIIFILNSSMVYGGCPGSCLYRTSGTTEYTRAYDIRECNDAKICPETHYYEEYTATSIFNCTSCTALSCGGCSFNINGSTYSSIRCADPATCAKWKSVGTTDAKISKDYVCIEGPSDTSSRWVTSYSAPGWDCQGCVNFAYWLYKNGVCKIKDYPKLSFEFEGSYPAGFTSPVNGTLGGAEVNLPVTGKDIGLKFNVHIEACQDRIPMLHINASLIDPDTGKLKSTVTGIYLKHRTLSYEDNAVGLRGLHVPEGQNTFKKKYTLVVRAKAYRAWAFRKRFAEAIDRIGSALISAHGMLPGITSIKSDYNNYLSAGAYFNVNGDRERIYYSPDFIAGLIGGKLNELNMVSSSTLTFTQKYDVDFYSSFPNVGDYKICTASDLRNYYDKYGMTDELKDAISSVTGISPDHILSLESVIGKTATYTTNADTEESSPINVTELGFSNSTEFINYVDHNITRLVGLGVLIPPSKATCDASDFSTAPKDGCILTIKGPYLKDWDIVRVDDTFVKIKASYYCEWDVNGEIGEIDIKTNYSDQKWSYAALADVNPSKMAVCLYYWNKCILNKREVNFNGKNCEYYEAAVCGMGPASDLLSSQETQLYTSTGKDGAVGEKEIKTTITVYRSCDKGQESWVSYDYNITGNGPARYLPAGLYACNGAKGYPVLKCVASVDSTEDIRLSTGEKFVKTVNEGELVYDNQSGKFYVCEKDTWMGDDKPAFLPDVMPPVVISAPYEIRINNTLGVQQVVFHRPLAEDVRDANKTVGKSKVKEIRICESPECHFVICKWKGDEEDPNKDTHDCIYNLDSCDTGTLTFYVVVEDKAGNVNYTTVKVDTQAAEGCGCKSSSDCITGYCLNGKCVKPTTVQQIQARASGIEVEPSEIIITVGTKARAILIITNKNMFDDDLQLNISLDRKSPFLNVYIDGYKGSPNARSLSFTLPAGEVMRIPVTIEAVAVEGNQDTYTLQVDVTSKKTEMRANATIPVIVRPLTAESAEHGSAPGISIYNIAVGMLLSVLVFIKSV